MFIIFSDESGGGSLKKRIKQKVSKDQLVKRHKKKDNFKEMTDKARAKEKRRGRVT